jgi:signal peptidase I
MGLRAALGRLRPSRSGRPSPLLGSQHGGSFLAAIAEVAVTVGAAFVLALLIQQFLVKPFFVPTVSMEPTILVGDRVLADRLTVRFSDPEPGQIIVFRSPRVEGEDLIKRAVAVEGDTVAVREGRLWVNGEPQEESYLRDERIDGAMDEIQVPEDHFWAMGDNRNNSGDSRIFGPVPYENILGRAFFIYWPPGRLGPF